jgi:hypothetical protein
MSVVDAAEGGIRTEHRTGASKRTKLTFLGIDKLIENLAAILTRAGARTIRTVVPDRPVRIAVDGEDMAQAFTGLAACGAAVTILGGVVPIEAGVENEGTGCALLSMSVRARQAAESAPSKDAVAALRRIIKKHHGSFRLSKGRDEMQFSLYLPVLRGA